MQDIRVRKAINMAIDREGIAKEIYRRHRPSRNTACSRPAPTPTIPNFKSYSYDPEGAKKLLAEAGYANGLKLVFELPQYGTGELVETWIQRDLKKVGIDVELQKYEWVTYMGKWAGGMARRCRASTRSAGACPRRPGSASCRAATARPPGGINSGWYCNKEVDKLLDAAILSGTRRR